MPNIYIDSDEWYPVFSFDTEDRWSNPKAEVTENELTRLERAFKEFNWAQDLLEAKRKGHPGV